VRLPLRLPSQNSRPFDVVGLGQNSLDLVATVAEHPLPDAHTRAERLAQFPGGEVATAMVACSRLDCRTRYLGTFGNDAGAATVEATLRAEGVDLTFVRRVEAPNRFAFILVDRAGHRTVIWYRHPDIGMPAAAVDAGAASSGRVLLVDASDPAAATAAAKSARAVGSPVVLDIDAFSPGADVLLRSVDIVIASLSLLPAFGLGSAGVGTGEALSRLAADCRAAVTMVTLGEEGSLARVGTAEIYTPAFSVDVVDSTGAGDAFRGGFVASWLRLGEEAPVETLISSASGVAALNCRALGAQSGLPKWSDVDVLVTEHRYDRSK
jgi:sugar/nucleoside kinase (ribokinase family)